jgi:hypothetical protein
MLGFSYSILVLFNEGVIYPINHLGTKKAPKELFYKAWSMNINIEAYSGLIIALTGLVTAITAFINSVRSKRK